VKQLRLRLLLSEGKKIDVSLFSPSMDIRDEGGVLVFEENLCFSLLRG